MSGIIDIIDNLSKVERDTFVKKINDSSLFEFVPCLALSDKGFVRTSIGWVFIKEPKDDHPKFNDSLLPVGFISKDENGYCGELVNTEESYFKDYHNKLKQIYLEFKKS